MKTLVGKIREFHYFASPVPLVKFPVRTVILELAGHVLLYSPGPFTQSDVKWIKDLNKEIILVAPNLFHHLHLETAMKQFPEATVYGPKGLGAKRIIEGVRPISENTFRHLEDIEVFILEGAPKLNEILIYHKESKALIVCDLFFNMNKSVSALTNLMLGIVGCSGRFSQSRLIRYLVKDKKAFFNSVMEALENDIEIIIPSHGDISKDIILARQMITEKYAG